MQAVLALECELLAHYDKGVMRVGFGIRVYGRSMIGVMGIMMVLIGIK